MQSAIRQINEFQINKMSSEPEIHYELMDNGGSNALWLPIIMPVGTHFHHEFGTYKVVEHKNEDNNFVILCERKTNSTHPILEQS